MPRAKLPKNIVTVGLPSPDQPDFFKHQRPAAATTPRPPVVRRPQLPQPEVLEPVLDGDVVEPQVVAGAKETHVFSLYLRANSLMLKSLMFFSACAALRVFLKAGVPFIQVMLGPVTMPTDTFFATGVLGLLNIIFGCATGWYALRAAELGHMAGIPFRQTATLLSRLLRAIGVSAFLLLVLLSVPLTIGDTGRLLQFVVNNAILHPNGYGDWKQELKRAR